MNNEKKIQNEFIDIFKNNKQQFYNIQEEYYNLLKIARIKDYIELLKERKNINNNIKIDNILNIQEAQNRRNKKLKEFNYGTSILRDQR